MILVRDEMGHKNLRTTERYCNIPIDRLADDFPSYVKTSEIDALRPQIKTPDVYGNEKDWGQNNKSNHTWKACLVNS